MSSMHGATPSRFARSLSAVFLSLCALGAANADERDQAKRIHDRLAGVPPTEAVLEDNKSRWSGSHLMAPEVVPGILLVNRTLQGSGYDLTDVTATLLDHYGLPPAEGMVGRSIFAN